MIYPFITNLETRYDAQIGLTFGTVVFRFPPQYPPMVVNGVPTIVTPQGWAGSQNRAMARTTLCTARFSIREGADSRTLKIDTYLSMKKLNEQQQVQRYRKRYHSQEVGLRIFQNKVGRYSRIKLRLFLNRIEKFSRLFDLKNYHLIWEILCLIL